MNTLRHQTKNYFWGVIIFVNLIIPMALVIVQLITEYRRDQLAEIQRISSEATRALHEIQTSNDIVILTKNISTNEDVSRILERNNNSTKLITCGVITELVKNEILPLSDEPKVIGIGQYDCCPRSIANCETDSDAEILKKAVTLNASLIINLTKSINKIRRVLFLLTVILITTNCAVFLLKERIFPRESSSGD